MEKRIVNENISLLPYFENDKVTLSWYQDLDICKQVDNRDDPYDLETLHKMYAYLNSQGSCFYISYKDKLVGDITLQDNGEISIVVSNKYQNMHIGRLCIKEIIALAQEKHMDMVKANIYSFNKQSRRMFEGMGFKEVRDEWFVYKLK